MSQRRLETKVAIRHGFTAGQGEMDFAGVMALCSDRDVMC